MKRCFIISPIGQEGSDVRKHADFVYYFIIKPALDEHDIEAVRSDHLNEPGKISDQMFREILNDDLCIAVLTGHNPNVFYELAIAQSASRPVILLIEKGQNIPFDIQDLRCVVYELEPKALIDKTYANQVAEHIRSLEVMNWRVTNPIGNSTLLTTSLSYSLFIIAPAKRGLNLNAQSLMANIEWEKNECYLVSSGVREKISLIRSHSLSSFEVRIERSLVERIINQPIELELRDRKGNAWRVDPFYLFQSKQALSLVEPPEKIASDYQEQEDEE